MGYATFTLCTIFVTYFVEASSRQNVLYIVSTISVCSLFILSSDVTKLPVWFEGSSMY